MTIDCCESGLVVCFERGIGGGWGGGEGGGKGCIGGLMPCHVVFFFLSWCGEHAVIIKRLCKRAFDVCLG